MHILIDLERMVAVYKHPNPGVLDALATIELSHRATLLTHMEDVSTVERFTDFELQKLYTNLTGDKLPGYLRPQNLSMVFDALKRLPVAQVVPMEVFAQAATIKSDDDECYRYVKGSTRPALLQELWDPPPITTTPSNPSVQAPPRSAAAAAPAPDPVRAPATPRAAAPRAPRGEGGAKTSIIWQVTDELWQTAGSPTDIKTVLGIRKQAMDKLEKEHGVKRTTSSSSLAGWQKDRLKI